MDPKFKNILLAVNRCINYPFVVFDNEGKIVSYNNEAEALFDIESPGSNLFDKLSFESGKLLNDLIESSYENTVPDSENFNFILKDGSVFNSSIKVNTYKEENRLFVFLSVRLLENRIEVKGTAELKIELSDIRSVINNDDTLKTIGEIKSLYPFTFIGKEKILKSVDKLEEIFFIKDTDGNLVLVNNKMAAGLGLKPRQIEGKPAGTFIQPFIADFAGAIDKYISESVNCMVIEGIPVSGVASEEIYKTILIPLTDADMKVTAIIGIGQKLPEYEKTVEGKTAGYKTNIFMKLPYAVAAVDKNGKIEHYSQEFCKLSDIDSDKLKGEHYSRILPADISEKAGQFGESGSLSIKFESRYKTAGGDKHNAGYTVYLDKIIDDKNNYCGFSISLKEINIDQNFENIIKRRGRMFEILIQNNPEPMFIYDTENLRFIEVNDAALNLYGYRKDEFLQMDLTDLYTPEDIQTLLDSSSISAREGKFTGPFKHKKKDGSFIFVEISKIGFNYNDKNAHFNVIRDVTGQLELEKKNQLFRTAFENTGDLLFITDNVGIISFVNNPVKAVLGYRKEELNSTSFSALVRNEERGTLNSSVFQSHIKDTISVSMELKKDDGTYIESELTASPILDYKNEVESFCIIAKLPRESAKEPQETVKEVIKEVVKEVIVEKPVPIEANIPEGTNANFFSSLFHEILTPINVILGFVQEFTENSENLSPEQKEAAEIINQNRDRLLNTMNSVIEFSSIEKGDTEIKPEEVSITEVIDRLYNEYKEIVGLREVEFAYGKISSSLKFVTDKQKFQTLVGLLVKISAYINKEKKIYFSAYPYEQKSFVISIKDNYSHVSKYFMESLTGIFNTEDSTQIKDFGISKLTMRLARSLIELLDGRLEIFEQGPDKVDYAFIFPLNLEDVMEVRESGHMAEVSDESILPEEEIFQNEPSIQDVQTVAAEEEDFAVENGTGEIPCNTENTGPGTDFGVPASAEHEEIVSAERSVPEEKQVPEPEEKSGEESGKKEHTAAYVGEQVKPLSKSVGSVNLNLNSLACLYIEDQVDSQILFKVQMKELNDIKFAVSFEEALPLLDSSHFDFIVMDINLQGEYNGLDALRIIHKMPGYENIPIIAVTAYVLPGDKEKFIATGFNDFISKPIFREKMIDSLERIFLMQI